jgi:hypothetical protein
MPQYVPHRKKHFHCYDFNLNAFFYARYVNENCVIQILLKLYPRHKSDESSPPLFLGSLKARLP